MSAREPIAIKRALNTAGQSTIEFALMFVLLMSVIFFVLQLSLTFSFGNYVHYATFMSARALLSTRASAADQQAAADGVLSAMLGPKPRNRFGFIGTSVNEGAPLNEVIGPDANYKTDGSGNPVRAYSWLQGVRYTFRSRLFRVPMAGLGTSSGSGSTSVNTMTLTSESWLGREPSAEECKKFMSDEGQTNGNSNEVLDNESNPGAGC